MVGLKGTLRSKTPKNLQTWTVRILHCSLSLDLDTLEFAISANSGDKKSADVWIMDAISTVQVVLVKILLEWEAPNF